MSYMGCHPNPIDELIFFRGVGQPPTRSRCWETSPLTIQRPGQDIMDEYDAKATRGRDGGSVDAVCYE